MNKKFCLWSLVVTALMAVCSCSSSKTDDLLSLAPADADYVIFADAKTIIESAGGSINNSQLVLPGWTEMCLSFNSSDDIDEFNDMLEQSGIDPDAFLLVGSLSDDYTVTIASISDKGKFADFVQGDMRFDNEDKEGDVTYYTTGDRTNRCIAISGSHAYLYEYSGWRDSKNDPKDIIADLIANAKRSPFSKTTMAKYISSGNAVGATLNLSREFLEDFYASESFVKAYSGHYCLKCSLGENDITIESKIFDEDGNAKDIKDFEKIMDMLDLKAKVSPDALAYMGENESLVMAASLKDVDWSETIDMIANVYRLSRYEKTGLNMAKDYLKDIDGTVSIGIGLNNGIESLVNMDRRRDVLSQFDFTLLIETKDGKAQKLMTDLTDLLNGIRFPYKGSASKGLTIDSGEGLLYVAAEGDFIIASNHEIKKSRDNRAVKALDFPRYIAATALALEKDNRLLKDLDIDSDISLYIALDADDMSLNAKLTIKGGKGKGVLEKLGNVINKISDTDMSKFDSRGSDNYYEDEYDNGFGI